MESSAVQPDPAIEPLVRSSFKEESSVACFHCGTTCRAGAYQAEEKAFCCQGCLTVFELLTSNGLTEYYRLNDTAGVRVKASSKADQYKYLDEESIRSRLANFADSQSTRITLRIPAIHCIACVWLLENLFRLKEGIGSSTVNFPRKEVAITFDHRVVKLSEVVSLLASLGYEPELKFSDLDAQPKGQVPRRLWIQLGLAGFAFGNIMLFSISSYLGLDSFSGPTFKKLVGILSLLLATPVVTYSALDYWRSALVSLKQKLLTIEVPIAAGILAIYLQSVYEVLSGAGEGYFDSLCGLIFFLLCGRLFQQKTFDRLAFDRDYKSFFPLSVTRRAAASEEHVSLAQLQTGDRLVVRNGELIPADCTVVSGQALIDYSFVTGEAEPVEKEIGSYLYAGGRQIGGALELEMVKPVSQSYLTSLWNQEAFRKENAETLQTLTNKYSERFTRLVILIALGSALFWSFSDPARALKAFTSVLIVACPCALALAAPFTLGTALRVLGRRNIFVKSPNTIEALAEVNSIVFDKTGTLTAPVAASIRFNGEPLNQEEQRWIYSMTRHSTHPFAVRIGEAIAHDHFPEQVRSFLETAGCGMEGSVARHEIWMGSAAWLRSRKVQVPTGDKVESSVVHVALDGRYRGAFLLASALRAETGSLLQRLGSNYDLALLSGDNAKERARFEQLFGQRAELRFEQSPLNKLNYIKELQGRGRKVMMVGDGLNDAGALKQSNVGVAVVEKVSAFSPASDVIMSAGSGPRVDALLKFSKASVRTVRAGFIISAAYNVIGIAIAASGLLSPIVCAILMPVSSVTVVGFACGSTTWVGRKLGLGEPVKGTEA